MYASAKMILLETIPVMGQRRIKKSSREDEFKYDIFNTL
jgi:hypothetical protein